MGQVSNLPGETDPDCTRRRLAAEDGSAGTGGLSAHPRQLEKSLTTRIQRRTLSPLRSARRPCRAEHSKIDLPAIPTDSEAAPLQVSDIEFRGETLYFIMVDRFHDGDPTNSAGPDPNLFDPTRTDWGKYWGGDLQGVLDKLDYLQACGVTAVWLTPLFEQIERMSWDAAPIHGYWTKDFKRINPRFVGGPHEVSLFARRDTVFDKLVAELHNRRMKLVLDIVCNHSSPDAAGVKGQLFDDGRLVADFNDDREHWYHHYGEVRDWNDAWQVQNRAVPAQR